MSEGDRPWMPRFKRVPVQPLGTLVEIRSRPVDPHSLRQDFASKVIRRLMTAAKVAVIEEHGRPALVDCSERLYELLAQDHLIIGVYDARARIKHVIEDLEAAGL